MTVLVDYHTSSLPSPLPIPSLASSLVPNLSFLSRRSPTVVANNRKKNISTPQMSCDTFASSAWFPLGQSEVEATITPLNPLVTNPIHERKSYTLSSTLAMAPEVGDGGSGGGAASNHASSTAEFVNSLFKSGGFDDVDTIPKWGLLSSSGAATTDLSKTSPLPKRPENVYVQPENVDSRRTRRTDGVVVVKREEPRLSAAPLHDPLYLSATDSFAIPATPSSGRPRPTQTFSERFKKRPAWMPNTSRSPSPSPTTIFLMSSSATSSTPESLQQSDSSSSSLRPRSLTRTLTSRLRNRQPSFPSLDSNARPSAIQLPKSQSAANLSSLSNPLLTPKPSSDRLSSFMSSDLMPISFSSKARQARKRDELWTSFRDLESACTKFQSKSGDQKLSIFRTTLIVFLNDHLANRTNTPKISGLHPEDLERRLSILHKWWSALLTFTQSREFIYVSHPLKAMIYESFINIMERPEWITYPSPFHIQSCQQQQPQQRSLSSSESEESPADLLLIESLQHNIRNWVSQCLSQQIGLVISAPNNRAPILGFNIFLAKTCAFAYFYCPGIARVLINLWSFKTEHVKKVFDQHGLNLSDNLSDVAEKVSNALPDALKDMQFSSLKSAISLTRPRSGYPIGTKDHDWAGPWTNRWTGMRDTLFYAFLKEYHILLEQHLPIATSTERLFAAGGVFIQAQMLVNMIASVQKTYCKAPEVIFHPGSDPLVIPLRNVSDEPPTQQPSLTLDQIIQDSMTADITSSSTVPSQVPNHLKRMSENRLLLLLKDVLFNNRVNNFSKHHREAFAHTFNLVLCATAKSIPLYAQRDARKDIEYLFLLLEETVLVFVRYERIHSLYIPLIDWSFWFAVWQKILKTDTLAHIIRVYSIIYTLWPAISCHTPSRNQLCFDFLLEREHFERHFMNWNSLVRTYFMRVVCWRICKINEEPDDSDLRIIELVQQRISDIHAHCLYLASTDPVDPISTDLVQGLPLQILASPQLAAANRRLLIMRVERPSAHAEPGSPRDPLWPVNMALQRAINLEHILFEAEFSAAVAAHGQELHWAGSDDIITSRPHSAMSSSSSSSSIDVENTPRRWASGMTLFKSLMSGSSSSPSSLSSTPALARRASMLRSKSQPPSRGGSHHLAAAPASPAPPVVAAAAAKTTENPLLTAIEEWRVNNSRWCFRFSLEPTDAHGHNGMTKEVVLVAPRLTNPAWSLLVAYKTRLLAEEIERREGGAGVGSEREKEEVAAAATTNTGLQPQILNQATRQSLTKAASLYGKYCARSLAEWQMVVSECCYFFSHRVEQGAPGYRFVEVPALMPDVGFKNQKG